jgi:cytidylate kinase
MPLGLPRTIEQIVEDQARRWGLPEPRRADDRPAPVVTLSRQHGAGGSEIARSLATRLHLHVFDQEIIRKIAESTHLSETAIRELDERDHALLADWLMALADPRHLDPIGYRQHLTRLVRVLARRGGAVIVGRGAHLILSAREALRVLVVAPLSHRVEALMRREGLSERAARERIAQVDGEREAFLKRHFHAAFADVTLFDVVVNTAEMGVPAAAAAIEAALAQRPAAWGPPPA